MRTRVCLPLITVLIALPAAAATPSLEEIWRIVESQRAEIESQRAEIEALKSRVAAAESETDESLAVTEERLDLVAQMVESRPAAASSGRKTHIGGYGELHYNNLDADDAANDVDQVDFHRFVMFLSHDFSDRVRFFSEWEIEHALAEDTADGSGPGEVEIEQAFIELDLTDQYYLRTGLFLLPVGILNETHEPPTFYGVERNDVESIIIPSTWWEAGADIGGRYANGISWDFALHSGLAIPTTGGDAFRVRDGRQKVAEAIADDFAWTARVQYTGIPGLELSGSFQYQQDVTQESGDGLEEGRLVTAHAIYQRGPFGLRALWGRWDFDGSAVEAAGADTQDGWYIEPSYRFDLDAGDFGVYTRYEDLDGAIGQERFDQWEVGLNYYPVPGVVFKVDYRDRSHDAALDEGSDFEGFDLGVGYQF